LSCDSSKCDLKRSYGLPSDEQEQSPEDRQLTADIAINYTQEMREYAEKLLDLLAGSDGKRLQRLMLAGLVNGNSEAKQP
jgi:hypothetical protein